MGDPELPSATREDQDRDQKKCFSWPREDTVLVSVLIRRCALSDLFKAAGGIVKQRSSYRGTGMGCC